MSLNWTQHRLGDFSLDVAWRVEPGEVLVLSGHSGAGKSMTLRAVAGLLRPNRGRVEVDGQVVFDSETGVWVPPHQRGIGYVPQHYALFPHLTAAQNVAYGMPGLAERDRRRQVATLLDNLHLAELSDRYPGQLSGGQQQRVALARTLATRPRLLLLDEPLAALDPDLRRELRQELRRTLQSWAIPTMLVTHDRDDVLALGHRVLMLEEGRVIAEGEPVAVLRQPGVARVARLVGVENLFHGRVVARSLDEGTTTCQVDSCRLVLPWLEVTDGQVVQFGLRAADVLLATAQPREISAQNVLSGTVQAVRHQDGKLYVEVDCGVSITASVTQRAVDSLALRCGREVWVVVKATSFFLVEGS